MIPSNTFNFIPNVLSNNQFMKRLREAENHEFNNSNASNVLQIYDDIIGIIFCSIESTEEKNKFSLVCKKWLCVSNEQTHAITLLRPWKCSADAKLSLTDLALINNRFKNLSCLNLSCNYRITDLGIANLTKLTHLNLSENTIISNSGISNLTNLTHLYLEGNLLITDSGIANLTKLTHLDLSNNPIISYSGISNLINLNLLNLRYNQQITDSEIAKLTQLTDLNLFGNQLITNSGIEYLTNLSYLNCCCDGITEDGIANLTKLIYLNSSFTITDVTIIDFTNLRNLTLKSQDLVTDGGIKELTQLTELTICNKLVTDHGLSHLTNLTKLNFDNTNSISFTWLGIRKLKNLRNLNYLKDKFGTEFMNKCRRESIASQISGDFCKSVEILEFAFNDFPSKISYLDRATLQFARSKLYELK